MLVRAWSTTIKNLWHMPVCVYAVVYVSGGEYIVHTLSYPERGGWIRTARILSLFNNYFRMGYHAVGVGFETTITTTATRTKSTHAME